MDEAKLPLLWSIEGVAELRRLGEAQLPILADELRQFLIHEISERGGHFGANLGVVELSIALHYVFQTPHDALVWDVGHQAYAHKILTDPTFKKYFFPASIATCVGSTSSTITPFFT